MPIYAYRCEDCGFAKDVLQKLSDKPLTACPSCGKDTFKKQITAAAVQSTASDCCCSAPASPCSCCCGGGHGGMCGM